MRIGYTSDLHGSAALYQQLAEWLRREPPDWLILGGDLFPDGHPNDAARSQGAWVRGHFLRHVERWLDDRPGLRVFIICGNHDWRPTLAATRDLEARGVLSVLGEAAVRVSGVALVGVPYTPWTPFHVKDFERRDLPGDPIPSEGGWIWDAEAGRERLVDAWGVYGALPSVEQLLAAAERPAERTLLVTHAPPHGSALDRLPNVAHHVGSRAVRAHIESSQPHVSLHGHLHEAPLVSGAYRERIGETISINPGQTTERLHGVSFDLDDVAGTLRHTVLG